MSDPGDASSGSVNHVGQTLDMPQVKHREMVIERDGYRGGGVPTKLTDSPVSVRFGPRVRGADTDVVLSEIGLSADEVASLRESGVLPPRPTVTLEEAWASA